MYCHSMASFAVSETMAMTRDERLAPLVRSATRYTIAAQHPTDGGWRYRPGDTGDTSQLGWQVMVLRSAERCEVAVPPVIWTRVDRFLRQVERGHSGGLAVYRPEEARPSRTMTAEALYCRQLVTGRADGGLTPAALREAVESLLVEPPSTAQVNLYYWYYATLALHRAQHVTPEAGAADAHPPRHAEQGWLVAGDLHLGRLWGSRLHDGAGGDVFGGLLPLRAAGGTGQSDRRGDAARLASRASLGND
jgi:hypothetical protein